MRSHFDLERWLREHLNSDVNFIKWSRVKAMSLGTNLALQNNESVIFSIDNHYLHLPPPQIPVKSQLSRLRMERRRHLSKARLTDRMSQVHRRANILVDLQISWDKCKCCHEVSWSPGCVIRLCSVERIGNIFVVFFVAFRR